MCAVMSGDEDTVKHLSNMGADQNVKSHEGMTPHMVAKKYGHTNIIKYLNDCPMNPIEELYKRIKSRASP